MKFNTTFLNRQIALIMSLLIVVFSIVSCTQSPITTETSETAGDTSKLTKETDEAASNDGSLPIFENGKYTVRIITPAASGSIGEAADTISSYIARKLKEETGVTADRYIDRRKFNDEDNEIIEILVGPTVREESIKAHEDLGYNEYAVACTENKILVCGYTAAELKKAANQFLNSVIKNKAENGDLFFDPEDQFTRQNTSMLNSLPVYLGGGLDSIIEAGDNTKLVVISNTSSEEFNEYKDKLEEHGFEEYTSREIKDNQFTTYKNEKYTVNASYYDFEKSARITIERLARDTGLKEDDKYEAICEPMITMIGLEANSDTRNGLSLLIRLEDGRFIVIDGGHNAVDNAKNLYDEIKRQAKDYAAEDKDIEIAAWVITHVHGDHVGMLCGQKSTFKDIKIDRVIANVIDRTELDKAKADEAYKDNYSDTEGHNDVKIGPTADYFGAYYHKAHTGQVFYMGGCEMEILYSPETYSPRVFNAFNTTSLVLRFVIKDQVIIVTGDATGNALEITADMYGDYLKCDIMTVAHHGYSTWGNNDGVIKAYDLMRPSTVLWVQGSTTYPTYKTKEYNKVLFEYEEFKEVFVAGKRGEYTRLTLPYFAKEQKAAA